MTAIGTRVDEIGTLIRDGGAFYLCCDLGGRYQLELHRTPVDLVEKRVRLVGSLVGPDLFNPVAWGPPEPRRSSPLPFRILPHR